MMDRAFFVEWRKRQGFTQTRVAEILSVNPSAVKRWESGERRIPLYMGLLMAAIENRLKPVGEDHAINFMTDLTRFLDKKVPPELGSDMVVEILLDAALSYLQPMPGANALFLQQVEGFKLSRKLEQD